MSTGTACGPAGRLGKGAQPAVLLDGRQLGPVAQLAPLLPPRPLAPRAPADAADAARALFLQGQARPHSLLTRTIAELRCKQCFMRVTKRSA